MKILKIELQNINSLKSETSIVIDFESTHFRDVGLYAITGSTGAGKTTILDALTIALYHNVPRFAKTKGTLQDVVSFGANDAFSRITFENKKIVYEAYWGIRIADSTGKKYKNAKEEVSLKNLTTGKTLADQKRKCIEEVQKVTQLDYTQFLRSVLLAQGEFASFLSAKGPEKGKLLEQITGEEIYKKIGLEISDRKNAEEKKLEQIQTKINADDVLAAEEKIELTKKDKELDAAIKETEKEIKTIQTIVDWFIALKKLEEKKAENAINAEKIAVIIAKNKADLDLLALNEKAEPFKEKIQEWNRTEKSEIEKTKILSELEKDLEALKPKIETLAKQNISLKTALELAEKEFTDWLPKFDEITMLDNRLKNESENKLKTTEKLEEFNKNIDDLKQEKEKFHKEFIATDLYIKNGEKFIEEHKFLRAVASEFSNWTTDLTTLKATKEKLNEDLLFISEKTNNIAKTKTERKQKEEILAKKTLEIGKIEKQLKQISEQLSENKISDLLTEKEKISVVENNLKQFKTYAEQFKKALKEQKKIAQDKQTLSEQFTANTKQIAAIKIQIEDQEKAVGDAEKILNLEKSIVKYEADRKNLVSGEACGLCGSKEHPFTKHLQKNDVSKAELEFEKRKECLQTLHNSKNELDKNELKLSINLDLVSKKMDSLNEDLKTLKTNAKLLNTDCKLEDLTKIDSEISLTNEQIKTINQKLNLAQEFQTNKNTLAQNMQTQNESIQKLKTESATLTEKNSNLEKEIAAKETTVALLKIKSSDLENDLKIKLAKFNYKIPAIEKTQNFIQEIEECITNFHSKEKKLDRLKAAFTVLETKIENNKKQLASSEKTATELIETIEKSVLNFNILKTERTAILPLDISVETQREQLQKVKNTANQKLESNLKELQKLQDVRNEKTTLKKNTKEDLAQLTETLNTLKTDLEILIKSSIFSSKQEIEKALLGAEDKQRILKNKESIDRNKLKLKTLEEENSKAIELLLESKNFETTAEESQLSLENFETKNKAFLTEKGKIVEAFRKDQEIRDRNENIYKEIAAQEEVLAVWKELFKLLGGSKDAFNVYVQRLTLKHLLELANVHLFKLNKRYSLKMEENYKAKEELNFNLIDHYQTNQARLVDTSSGGEKFIISLALALGLSDLASKNVKIDSLFIDEGFGTLDSNTLETVISTLETLQAQGKMIGIISHVENLKERIPTQIQITKKSNGVSVVDIV
ncbi:MAG: AAA family ATPase [Chitinophagales bacterium]